MGCCSSTVPSASEEVIERFLDNVDVWQTIFEMLEVKDRIRLEKTNKRLHMMMLACWKRVTSFDTECLTGISHKSNHSRWNNGKRLSAALVSICVNRIGDGLLSLTIREKSTYPVSCWSVDLSSIGEGCPNVETINCVFEDKDGTVDIRFDSLSRLKTLTFRYPERHSATASASLFLSIPTSIEVIRGLGGTERHPFENAAQMEGFFAHRPSLKEVCLGRLCTRDKSKADIFRVIAERCPHLKSIRLSYSNYIDYSGVIALESMKELRLFGAEFDEMDIVTICKRSPLVEALEFWLRLSSNIDLQSAALNALGSLTKLAVLSFHTDWHGDVFAPSLVTEFVRNLVRNSGASLRYLCLPMYLPTAAIEALAIGCGKLRYLDFCVRVGEATPASIRFLIDSIVAHPGWIPQTYPPTLVIAIYVMRESEDEVEAGRAAFKALADWAANLPSGVELHIC